MIGIFDSGVGGLTVAKEIKDAIPDAPILYLGDTARVPYGGKSKKIITKYSLEIVDFLITSGAEIIVIGCNTASANAAEAIREKYPDTPIYDVTSSAMQKAVQETKNEKIGIIGTEATIASHVYQKELMLIRSSLKLTEKACPLFVPLVEENRMHTPETKEIIASYFESLHESDIDTLILGCTHYPYLESDMRDYFLDREQRVHFIDTGHEVAVQLKNDLELSAVLRKKAHAGKEDSFFLTDITPGRIQLAEKLFKKEIHFKKAVIG